MLSENHIASLENLLEQGGHFGGEEQAIRAAISILRTEVRHAQPAEAGVTVKALEWDERNHADVYGVKDCYGQGPKRYFLYRASTIIGWYDDIEPAKAAAQTDHEARVRSAIVHPTPAPQGMEATRDTLCAHGIRWPWACGDCDRAHENALNKAAWAFHDEIAKHGPLTGRQFNNLKSCLRVFLAAFKSGQREA
jgi:hypothetical protein